MQLQNFDFSIQVRSLNAERLRRIADSAAVMSKRRGDIFTLEPGTCLAERRTLGRHDRAFVEIQVAKDVFDVDLCIAIQFGDDIVDERAQFGGVTPPRQCREQRQR